MMIKLIMDILIHVGWFIITDVLEINEYIKKNKEDVGGNHWCEVDIIIIIVEMIW